MSGLNPGETGTDLTASSSSYWSSRQTPSSASGGISVSSWPTPRRNVVRLHACRASRRDGRVAGSRAVSRRALAPPGAILRQPPEPADGGGPRSFRAPQGRQRVPGGDQPVGDGDRERASDDRGHQGDRQAPRSRAGACVPGGDRRSSDDAIIGKTLRRHDRQLERRRRAPLWLSRRRGDRPAGLPARHARSLPGERRSPPAGRRRPMRSSPRRPSAWARTAARSRSR